MTTPQSLPAFKLKDQSGNSISNSDLAGKWGVIFVYPKDDTPGCTIETKEFTAEMAKYNEAGILAFGLSADDVESHQNFCQKFSLTVPLIADPEEVLLKALRTPQADWKGTMYWQRTSYVFDPEGMIRKVYDQVNPVGHAEAVLNDIKQMMAGSN